IFPPQFQQHKQRVAMKLVIAGGGISALSLLKTLSLAPEVTTSIAEIVVYAPYGLGHAPNFFNQPQSSLCNTSAGVMSLVYDQPDQYCDWLRRQGLPYQAADFTPRSLFGQFLREEAYHVVQTFKHLGIPMSVVNESLTSFETMETQVLCYSKRGVDQADYLVMATGHQDRVASTPKYLLYPEHQDRIMDTVFDDQRVLVLGSRLSAVDAILLLEDKPLGALDVASRSARFPAVRKQLLRTPPQVLNVARILNDARRNGVSVYTQFTHAMHDEIGRHYQGTLQPEFDEATQQLALDIDHMLDNNVGWQDTLDNIMLHLNALWEHFTEEERESFYQQYDGFMKRYLYAFPVVNAQRLQRTLETFDARIFAADCRHICLDQDGKFSLGTSTYDYIIDATGCRKMPIARHGDVCTINAQNGDGNMAQTKFHLEGVNNVFVTGSIRTYLPVVNYVNEIAQFNQELVSELFNNIKNSCFV
ncbi:FAD/NAD(P)-binding protein, partial [Vibrio coralliilyticus]